jgi:hypothetical protein
MALLNNVLIAGGAWPPTIFVMKAKRSDRLPVAARWGSAIGLKFP